MRFLKIRVCSECPHHDPPTPIYPGYCSITRHESGFMGNPFEDYPKIPEWCPLGKSEPDELPEWFVNKLNKSIIDCGLLEAELRDDNDIEEAVSVSRRANTLLWVLSLRRGEE